MVRPGLYQHFKGGRYHVLGTATHSETGEKLVVYESFHSPEPQYWLRPVSMFEETVTHNGEKVARFRFLSH